MRDTYKYIIIIVLILFFLNYKKVVTFLLFNGISMRTDRSTYVNEVYKKNPFYQERFHAFFERYSTCTDDNFNALPFLTKEDLIEHNDDIIMPPYKKCSLTCRNSCLSDPVIYDTNCSIGQSTGGTSGKSTFVWMNKYDAFRYIYTFITSFKKNGYMYGDKIMVFYPSNSYFTNEYERSNWYLLFMNIYFLSFKTVDKEKTIEFVESINKNRPDFLVIFPFVLLQLCININRYGIELKHFPRNINLSGEYLLQCSLDFCRHTFKNSNIENTYGAVEFGEIAHQVKGEANTYEVFNQFCYLENKDDKIVVTSFINSTFPIIRYVMEDIGNIVNKNGKQYIMNLVGKNTNQITIQGRAFTSIDVDSMITSVNKDGNIVSIVIEYDSDSIDVTYIIYKEYTSDIKRNIMYSTREALSRVFKNVNIDVRFTEEYKHDYLKKFKIIIKKNNIDNEPVGGYFKY